MILFVGDVKQGFFIEEFDTVDYTGYGKTLLDLQEKIITTKAYDYIVIDVGQFSESAEQQVNEICQIKNATNAEIVILAIGYKNNSSLLMQLKSAGVQYFITSPILSHQKQALQDAFAGIPTEIKEAKNTISQEPTLQQDYEQISKQEKRSKIIAIAGAQHRIGTTTQALQIVKYLSFMGYKAAYVEMNGNAYVEQLQRVYCIDNEENNEKLGLVNYQNVPMFCKKENISEILKLEYDFLVYDFGTFDDSYFNIISFIEKDISIIVGGTKPNELENMTNVISKTIVRDCYYIFSFSHQAEHSEILELMEERADNTTFATYSPDPFLYAAESNKIYQKIIPLHTAPQVDKQQSKHFLKIFRRGKEKK